MPVNITSKLTSTTIDGQKVTVVNDEISSVTRAKTDTGEFVYLFREEPVISVTDVVASCDNPNCQALNAGRTPEVFEWNQERSGENPDEVPDGMYRTIGIKLFDMNESLFCGKTCAIDFLRNMVPLRSPREQRVDKVVSIANGGKG